MSKEELSEFIQKNLTFEVLPKSKEILWYISEETTASEEEKDKFFIELNRVDQWELVLNIM